MAESDLKTNTSADQPAPTIVEIPLPAPGSPGAVGSAASAPKKKPAPPTEPAISKFQKFTMERIPREMLRDAPYNPRIISDDARERLRKNLKERGLVQPLIWNRTTGHILSGHQRVSILDTLEGNPKYLLDVAVVEMDEKAEQEQNLFLNNYFAQGDWDIEKLDEMVPHINIEGAGFDLGQLTAITGHLQDLAETKNTSTLTEKLREVQKAYDGVMDSFKKTDRPTEFYLVIVFKDYSSRVEFTTKAGLPNAEFLDGRLFSRRLGIADPPAPIALNPESEKTQPPPAPPQTAAPPAPPA